MFNHLLDLTNKELFDRRVYLDAVISGSPIYSDLYYDSYAEFDFIGQIFRDRTQQVLDRECR